MFLLNDGFTIKIGCYYHFNIGIKPIENNKFYNSQHVATNWAFSTSVGIMNKIIAFETEIDTINIEKN